jgi:hypothetical protein
MSKTLEKFQILTLEVQKDARGRWVFDDPEHEIWDEPFVAGMDLVLDHLFARLGKKEQKMSLNMREAFGVGSRDDLELTHMNAIHHPLLGTSHYYWCTQLGIKAWLCPNLHKYIQDIPQVLWVWAEA